MSVNRQWVLARIPRGILSRDDFEYREASIPAFAPGEILLRVLCLSMDAGYRFYVRPEAASRDMGFCGKVGEPMPCYGIGRVVESKHPSFQKGDLVRSPALSWQDFVVKDASSGISKVGALPDGIPYTAHLSVLGLTGQTAYWGMSTQGRPKAGETVVVSGAAGATGSIAGQLARIQGARAIGIAGGPRKCQWLRDTARYDETIDYKSEDVSGRLRELCPNGVDIFFDTVGGDILESVIGHLGGGSRLLMCGITAEYNRDEPIDVVAYLANLKSRLPENAELHFVYVFDHVAEAARADADLLRWVRSGELAYHEDIAEGFDRLPDALIGLFTGKNLGKQLVKLAD